MCEALTHEAWESKGKVHKRVKRLGHFGPPPTVGRNNMQDSKIQGDADATNCYSVYEEYFTVEQFRRYRVKGS